MLQNVFDCLTWRVCKRESLGLSHVCVCVCVRERETNERGSIFFLSHSACVREERCGLSDMDEEEEKEGVIFVFLCFTGENQDKEER